MIKKISLMLFVCLISTMLYAQSVLPWVKPFTVNHTCNPTNSTELQACIVNAIVGEDIVLQDGVTYSGAFELPEEKPYVRLRCQEGQHCTITGGNLDMRGVGQQVVGIHKTHPGAINSFAMGQAIVNNFVEGASVPGTTGIGSWVPYGTPASSTVVYGNISLKWKHTLYTQNTSPTEKYIVSNIFQEALGSDQGRVVHAYTQEPNKMEDIKFLYNIVRGPEEFLVATSDEDSPILDILIKDNILYSSNLRIGYGMMGQYDIEQNRIFASGNPPNVGEGILQHHFIWGSNEGCFSYPPKANIVRGNIFRRGTVQYFVSRFTSSCVQENGDTHLRTSDDVDDNIFHTDFHAQLNAGGLSQGASNMDDWHTITSGQGNEYDTNSVVLLTELATGSRLYANDYAPTKRAHLAVWSFTGSTQTFRTFTRSGGVYNVNDPYGSPIVTFTANVSVGIPISGEFTAYLVKYN